MDNFMDNFINRKTYQVLWRDNYSAFDVAVTLIVILEAFDKCIDNAQAIVPFLKELYKFAPLDASPTHIQQLNLIASRIKNMKWILVS